MKYFTKPFRKDNYTSHLKVHSEKFAKYNALSNEEKKEFFKVQEKIANTLDTHFDVERKEHVLCFDADGFYRIWCALHQLDIVIQKCVLHYFSDDFYSNLTDLIGYLRRQQNLIQAMKKVP